MRIFVDTNIVSELLEERSQVDYIDRILRKQNRKVGHVYFLSDHSIL